MRTSRMYRSAAVAAAVLAASGLCAVALVVLPEGSERTLASYSTDLGGRNSEQLINIRKAARMIDGARVLPGEEFSLGRALGPTHAAAGWSEAPAIVRGEVEKAMAGGICQVSSTLYNCALLAGLKITERHAHSQPVASVPMGRDATVAWGIADLKFVNNRPLPVTIKTSAAGERLVISICGAGEKAPAVRIVTTTSRQGDRVVCCAWRTEKGAPGRELISRDEYRASRAPEIR